MKKKCTCFRCRIQDRIDDPEDYINSIEEFWDGDYSPEQATLRPDAKVWITERRER